MKTLKTLQTKLLKRQGTLKYNKDMDHEKTYCSNTKENNMVSGLSNGRYFENENTLNEINDLLEDNKETQLVWTHYHERTDNFIIFVAGHAIGKNSNSPRIANHIAKACGLTSYEHTTYKKDSGLPESKTEYVY
jgi:hypothetical protein